MYEVGIYAVPWLVAAASAALATCTAWTGRGRSPLRRDRAADGEEHGPPRAADLARSEGNERSFRFGRDGHIQWFDEPPAVAHADDVLQIATLVLPEHQARLEHALSKLTPQASSTALELRLHTRDGSVCWQRWQLRGRFQLERLEGFACGARDITREKELEERLADQVRVLECLSADPAMSHAIFEVSPDGSFRSTQGQRPLDDVRAPGDVWSGVAAQAISALGDGTAAAELQHDVEACTRDCRAITRVLRIAAGTDERWVRRCLYPLRDSAGNVTRIVASALDVTEQQRTRRDLLSERDVCREIVAACPAFLVLLDAEERIARVNRALCDAFDYTERELVGRNYWATLAPDATPERGSPSDPRALGGRPEEIELRDARGRARLVEWRWRVLRDERGQARYRLGIGLDVSERKREDWLARQQQQRVEADKMMAVGTFISGLAHEIGNPNQVIQINLPLLQESWNQLGPKLPRSLEGTLCSEVSDMLHEVSAASDRIHLLVSELHAYARGEATAPMSPVDLNEVVRSALGLLSSALRKSTRRFSVRCAERLPAVQGNLRRLEQVLTNLLLNACQALSDPEQSVCVETHFDAARREVVLTVRDEGVGIHPDHMSRILDPFFTTKRDRGGTGLGLAIAQRIAERHEGRIELESELGRGTIARLYIPVL